MSERMLFEFFLLRYVPDVVKGEFVNIGVIVREAGGRAPNQLGVAVRFTRNWSRVRCLDVDADIELLEALEEELSERLNMAALPGNPKPIVDVLEDCLSNSVQITEARGSLAEGIAAELNRLMQMYVDPIKTVPTREKTGRAAISRALRMEFERAGVWGLMQKRIAAAPYTQAGDPLRIDCGYKPNGIIRMFHAVSLDGDAEAAKVLAFSAPRLRDGVRRVEAAGLELTAVVESWREASEREDEAKERYLFGLETMEREAIRVVTVGDLAGAAMTARLEFGL